jgi:L-histidine N-alpha-methyltransferase
MTDLNSAHLWPDAANDETPDTGGGEPAASGFLGDVLAGLALPQKAIPARWFYDRRGSLLFEEITKLPEYYPTRVETALLERICGEVAELAGAGRAVIEFGSGSSTKTPRLLHCIDPAAYVPIDISGDFLRESAAGLAQAFPGLPVLPVEADFTNMVSLPAQVQDLPKLGFFPGSTIGNLVPAAAVDLLRNMAATLGTGAQLLIGMDRIKEEAVLVPAYDDAAGVTAAFNLNLLRRINRELGGGLTVEAFRHRAVWNDDAARIEMHLVATRDLAFTIAGHRFAMREGEWIHSENSHKYDGRTARLLLAAGGWTPLREWHDEDGLFSILLAEAQPEAKAP